MGGQLPLPTSSQPLDVSEKKNTWLSRFSVIIRAPMAPPEKYSLTTDQKALICNLMSMR
jgi:hypothetical protein